jgi:hypothetical protein
VGPRFIFKYYRGLSAKYVGLASGLASAADVIATWSLRVGVVHHASVDALTRRLALDLWSTVDCS